MSDGIFGGMRPVRPPDGLRERALRAARAAARERSAPGRAAWGFRRLDLVWVAALLLLAACNAMLAVSDRQAATRLARHSAPRAPEAPATRPADDRDLLALGLRLDAGSARRDEPTLSLEQALRAGS